MELIFSLDNIDETARAFWELAGDHNVFAFHGEMGAGKTTFIHALCAAKNVKDMMGSPTFSIINEYEYDEGPVTRKIWHMDLYRIRSEDEAIQGWRNASGATGSAWWNGPNEPRDFSPRKPCMSASHWQIR